MLSHRARVAFRDGLLPAQRRASALGPALASTEIPLGALSLAAALVRSRRTQDARLRRARLDRLRALQRARRAQLPGPIHTAILGDGCAPVGQEVGGRRDFGRMD